MKAVYLGIDIGTSAMKLLLMDSDKRILSQTTEEYELAQPKKGWNEIDPDIWYDCMKRGIARILQETDRSRLAGIGVTGQMHTLIVLGADGRPVRPAMMWNDIRTIDLLPGLRAQVKNFEEGDYLARTISTGSPAVNLYWLRKNEPAVFARIRKFLIGPDYLVYRLTGVAGTDYCEASTSCLFLSGRRVWSEEMKNLIGLTDEMYPEIHGSAVQVGAVLPELAAELGIPADVKVIAGTGDNPATAVSTGGLVHGYPVISLGTSGVLVTRADEFRSTAKGKQILISLDGETFYHLVQGAVQSNGSTLAWWVQSICGDDFSAVDGRITPEMGRDCQAIFYPHLCGDKTLYGDSKLRGGFFGLSMETTPAELMYAVIEGLCFAFRELAEHTGLPLLKTGSIKVVGGGARSAAWMQILANVTGVRIEQMSGQMSPAFGITLLSAYGCGSIASLEDMVKDTVCISRTFEPDPALSACCDERYARYTRIYRGLSYIMNGEAA